MASLLIVSLAERILGSVEFPSFAFAGPGLIRHVERYPFPVGELRGSVSERAPRVAFLFSAAGCTSFVPGDT